MKNKFRLKKLRRRDFLKYSGVAAGAGVLNSSKLSSLLSLNSTLLAQSQEQLPIKYFIEINLRDQWDFMNVFVPPGIAKAADLKRGPESDKVSLYHDQASLTDAGNGFFLTPDSIALQPHLESMAVVEFLKPTLGMVHGHEGLNYRSPGRSFAQTGTKRATWLKDPQSSSIGNGLFYSDVPTPDSVHNYVQKQASKLINNGITIKGIGRAGTSTVHHFGADLRNSELDRIQSMEQLQQVINLRAQPHPILSSDQELRFFKELVAMTDREFLKRIRSSESLVSNHESELAELDSLLRNRPTQVDLSLSEEDRLFWSQGVPDQVSFPVRMQIWEQVAKAFKLVEADACRTISIEFDYADIHGVRSESVCRTMAQQTALPLARLVEKLKAANLFDQTLIVVNSLDGGRSPYSESYGDTGQNTMILIGSHIKGGYYGDIRVQSTDANKNNFTFHRPDLVTGLPVAQGVADASDRIDDATAYRTVMKALRIPTDLYDGYADLQDANHMAYLLK